MERLAVTIVAVTGIVAAAAWTWPPAVPDSVAHLQGLLPRGSFVHSLVRLEVDGSRPLETAAVAALPAYPGAGGSVYYGFIFAYDRWRRRSVPVFAEPLAGPIPLAPDAGRIDERREAAIFRSLREDGTYADRVVGLVHGRLQEFDATRARQLIDGLPAAPAVATRQFRLRAGTIPADALVMRVHVRQLVQLLFTGGGPTPIIIPDPRLDILDRGYRARAPGTYHIRIFLPFASDRGATLTLLVEN